MSCPPPHEPWAKYAWRLPGWGSNRTARHQPSLPVCPAHKGDLLVRNGFSKSWRLCCKIEPAPKASSSWKDWHNSTQQFLDTDCVFWHNQPQLRVNTKSKSKWNPSSARTLYLNSVDQRVLNGALPWIRPKTSVETLGIGVWGLPVQDGFVYVYEAKLPMNHFG